MTDPGACTDIGCEKSYLSACLRRPDELDRHPVTPADLTSAKHMVLLSSLHDLRSAGITWRLSSLETELKELGRLERAGGWAYVLEVAAIESHAPAADARRLRRLARARRMRDAALRAAAACEKGLLDDAREEVVSVLDDAVTADVPRAVSAYELAQRTWTRMHEPGEKRGRSVRCGMDLLDNAIGGLPPGSLAVVGGRTGAGKSSVMLAWAMWQARAGHRPGIVSCEDAEGVWGPRLIAHLSGIDSALIHRGEVGMFDMRRVADACEAARHVHMELTFPIGRHLEAVRADVAHLVREKRCDIIYVDYLQAIRVDARAARYDKAVSEIAKALKADTARLGVPLVLGSQLSRADKAKPFAEPHLSDLKESGDIENESEVVLLLWPESDKEHAPALGKVAKVKWAPRRPRFAIERDESGAVVGAAHIETETRSTLYDRPNGHS